MDVFVWYNSNGYWNDAPQCAKQCMSNSIDRKREMKWLQKCGVKGLKVDFFGSDKQQMMGLYEDILSDANDHGLMNWSFGGLNPYNNNANAATDAEMDVAAALIMAAYQFGDDKYLDEAKTLLGNV
ncbi:glycosyl hydrolase family 8, partial [Vibrio sp. FNV 38]|nr:glycosyl hydrolase family 8 [Vibrio sp. FNV 38]